VHQYFGQKEAGLARKEFEMVFSKRDAPENLILTKCILEGSSAATAVNVMCTLITQGKFSLHTGNNSNNEVLRLFRQGAVKVNGEKVTDPNMPLELGKEMLLQVSKRSFVKVVISRKP